MPPQLFFATIIAGSASAGISHAALLDRPRALGVLWRVLLGAVFLTLAFMAHLLHLGALAWALGVLIGLGRRRLRQRTRRGGTAKAARPPEPTEATRSGARTIAGGARTLAGGTQTIAGDGD